MMETQERRIDRKALEQVTARAEEIVSLEGPSNAPAPWVQNAQRELRIHWIGEFSKYANEMLDADATIARARRDMQASKLDADSAERLIAHLDLLQGMLEAHANEARAAIRDSAHDAEMRRMAEIVLENASRLHGTFEIMRWHLLEMGADADIAAGRFKSFSSMSDAIAALRSHKS